MTAMDRRPARTIRRKQLRAIRESLVQAKSPFSSKIELESARVRRESMSLEKQKLPLFFQPYTASVLKPKEFDSPPSYPQPEDDHPHGNTSSLIWYLNYFFGRCILPEEPLYPPGSAYTQFGDLNFGLLCDTAHRPYWKVDAAWTSSTPGLPHMKVLMYTSATVKEDQLFCGELLAIIDVMRGRLHTKSLRSSTIAPVLLFSVVGLHHVRVLEAFFQDEELVVRTTGLYDLGKQDDELLMRLSRWWLGHASGRPTEVD